MNRRQAYDGHLNMVLGNVEETITIVDINEETLEEVIRVSLLVQSWNSDSLLRYRPWKETLTCFLYAVMVLFW